MVMQLPIARRALLGQAARAAALLPLVGAACRIGSAQAATPAAPTAPSPGDQAAASLHPSRPLPLVVLDPGHGGRDPGAVGVSGTLEKHIALATAQQLQRLLEAAGRYRVALTRADDVFIPLPDRVAQAQDRGAALFVSLHADALTDHDVRGASVYTLANTATDAQTAALAARENSADWQAQAAALRDAPPDVAKILASLVQQETRTGATRLARHMVGQLDLDVAMLPNPARQASFVVLKAADIPSVLVEMGFLSNPEDEAALRRADHRMSLARAMRRAVDAYFTAAEQAPHMMG